VSIRRSGNGGEAIASKGTMASGDKTRKPFALRPHVLLLIAFLLPVSAEENLNPPPLLSADVIVQKLMAANARRAGALHGYDSKRTYRLDYKGLFGSHDAEMQVEATYTAPDKKDFKVISESGSHLLNNRVLLRLIDSEKEAQEAQQRKALEITPDNYDFSLEGIQRQNDRDFYVLKLTPRGKSRYLYRGKIWVDAHDFAVARMQGEPQRNPSLWVTHTEIEYQWGKFQDFWLPIHNQSVTQVRMGGRAVLTIDYSGYEINGANRAATPGSGQTATLPAPGSVSADPH
jgi:hypothetical protein